MCKNSKSTDKSVSWMFLLRQLLIASGIWSTFFMLGLKIGAPTVLAPQLRNEANSTDAVTDDEFSGLVSKLILVSYMFMGVTSAFATTATSIISEYTSPEYRGLFLTLKSASIYWGVLVANAIGTFFHWRNTALLGLICTFYNLSLIYFWPESPIWLVRKLRFDQCADSHRWLKGTSENSETELLKLIAANETNRTRLTLKGRLRNMFATILRKEFFRPMLLCIAIIALLAFSGKTVCNAYTLVIMKKITNSTSKSYTFMLILDTVTLCTMFIGCVLSKKFKRRTLLFASSTIVILFLTLLSLYLYLIKCNAIIENTYVSISLLVGYSMAIACGPLILAATIAGELIPINARTLSLCVVALSLKIINGSLLKVSPYIFKYLEMHGTFLTFAISSSMFMMVLYYYLPETKDKTLQEIEEDIKGTKPVEESKELLPIEADVAQMGPSK